MAPRRRRACVGGHVTGYFAGGSREGLERARQTQCCSRIIHLAKLNPNCHMNYLDYMNKNLACCNEAVLQRTLESSS